ncbi:hypothetical protein [Pseudonocardia acidicola]|uniref:Uncharacterized protein n=1 Tax=Pseudonocardia acidicola TaxID=2724939 RepID=A0ABX1SLW0_9PSEU|nr:hypothetical protein [Pseudonocardia acidicola]NMI01563.1 hypothetical protein [Pseudonocardia acidicola]
MSPLPARDRPVPITNGVTTAVATYLTTPKHQVGPSLGQLFTHEAVVHDEGRTHAGLDAIRT